MKKLLALMLSVAMVLTMGTSVFAYSDVKEDTYVSEAVTVLSNLDILNGYEDGSFKPEATVTRAEMAKIICEMMGYDNLGNVTTVFNDVPKEHWASGYISTINGLGIICGYGDGNYGPEDPVTYNQAAKMIVCGLGYGVICDTYPSSYLAHANTLKLFTNVKGGGEVEATRGDIAILVYNALDAAMLVQTGFGSHNEYKVVEDDTLLSTRLDIAKVKGTVTSIDFKEKEAVIDVLVGDKSFDEIKDGTYTTAIDLTGYKNLVCTLYVDMDDDNEPTIVAAVASDKADTVVITDDELFEGYDEDKAEVEYYETIDSRRTKTIDLANNFAAYVNDSSDDVALSTYLGETEVKKAFDTITFIDADGDGDYETAIIEVIEAFVVKSVNERTMTIVVDKTAGYSFNKAKLVLDEDEVTWNIDTDISDIEAGDVVNVKASEMKSGTHYEIYVTNETIEGYIDSVDDDYYYIDDEPYTIVNNKNLGITLGTAGIFTLDMKGNIINVDTTVTATSAKWGYIVKTDVDPDIFDNDKYVAKLVTVDGDEEIYDFAEKVKFNSSTSVKTKDIYEDTLEDLTGLVGYKINSDDEITAIYTDYDMMNSVYDSTNGGKLRVKADGRLGSYYTSNSAIIFSVDTKDNGDIEVTIQPSNGLLADQDYTITKLVYNTSTSDLIVAVGIGVTAAADPSSPVMLVKSVSQGLDDMEIVEGYVDGELVEFAYDTYELTIDGKDSIEKGDLLQYTLSGDEAIGIRNLGNVTVGKYFYHTKANGKVDADKEAEKFANQDDGLFTHWGTVVNIRGVNVEYLSKDETVSMPGDYPVYRYDATGNRTYIYTDEFIEDITMDVNLDEGETNNERLVVVKYDNVPLIAVIVELAD